MHAWSGFDKSSFSKHFSRIYIEDGAEAYPDAQTILARFPTARRIPIRHYKDVFNRKHQDFQLQKRAMDIILAVKREGYLYAGSPQTPSFGHDRFFYNAMALNCVYNCDYCYLQGMFPSAHLLFFVNPDAFFDSVVAELAKGPLYLCVSYDTDLLAMESFLPQCHRWIHFAAHRRDLVVEIRTKSGAYDAIRDTPVSDNVILAWTCSPDEIIKVYESGTPPLDTRLSAMAQAVKDGRKVRLCIDPILKIKDWQDVYSRCIEYIFERIPGAALHDVSLGVFRMNKNYLNNIRAMRVDSDILFYPYDEKDQTMSYTNLDRESMLDYIRKTMSPYVQEERIIL